MAVRVITDEAGHMHDEHYGDQRENTRVTGEGESAGVIWTVLYGSCCDLSSEDGGSSSGSSSSVAGSGFTSHAGDSCGDMWV